MNKIQYGLKLWSINRELFEQAKKIIEGEIFQYLELYAVPGTFNENRFKELRDLPIVIHAPHFKHNFNLSKLNLKENNKKIFLETQRFADFFDSQYIIIHPGFGGTIDSLKIQLSELNDNRIVMENMPKVSLNSELTIGYRPEQIKEFLEIGSFNFCLDFAHAIKAAISQNLNYKDYLREFLKLKPMMGHISGGRLNNEKDEHLNFGQGDFDLKFLKKLIEENNIKKVTLETPKNNGLKQDIKNLEYLRNISSLLRRG